MTLLAPKHPPDMLGIFGAPVLSYKPSEDQSTIALDLLWPPNVLIEPLGNPWADVPLHVPFDLLKLNHLNCHQTPHWPLAHFFNCLIQRSYLGGWFCGPQIHRIATRTIFPGSVVQSMYLNLTVAIVTSYYIFRMSKSFHTYRKYIYQQSFCESA